MAQPLMTRWSANKGPHSLSKLSNFASSPRVPSIAETVALQASITFAYTLLIVIGANHPDSAVGQLMGQWIADADNIRRLLFSKLPGPSSAALFPIGLAVYRNILAVCLGLAGASFLLTRRYWSTWAYLIEMRFETSRSQSGVADRVMLVGHRLAVLGLLATALFLSNFAEAGWPYAQTWTLLSTPILVALGYWFACNAMMLRSHTGQLTV
jgi:hypothetical protein